MSKLPISLIIDDGGPINLFHFHQLDIFHPVTVPACFAKRFADICRKHGVRGKYSVVPMPAGLGRIDQTLSQMPKADMEAVLDVLRKEVAPMFSITSEILTHYLAYNLKGGGYCLHVCEDEYIRQSTPQQIADYVALSLDILISAGFNPEGVTSPWATGDHNEKDYAAGIGMAFKQRLNRNRCFYFLHHFPDVKEPVIMADSPETGTVVSIPQTTGDAFWCTQLPAIEAEARKLATEKIDGLLSPDGKTGIIRDRINAGYPPILITHWQSIFSDGRAIGLEFLDALCERINKYLLDEVEWQDFMTIANAVK